MPRSNRWNARSAALRRVRSRFCCKVTEADTDELFCGDAALPALALLLTGGRDALLGRRLLLFARRPSALPTPTVR